MKDKSLAIQLASDMSLILVSRVFQFLYSMGKHMESCITPHLPVSSRLLGCED